MTSIEKTLALLKQFTQAPHHYTVAELSAITGLNRTTVYRDVCMMEENGALVRREEGRGYAVGPLMYQLGHIYTEGLRFEERARAILREVAELTQTAAGLARREQDTVVSIWSVDHTGAMHPHGRPGAAHPIYKGPYGKGLMAFWAPEKAEDALDQCQFEKSGPNTLCTKASVLAEYDHIRRQGYATSIEETGPGVVGVGVPLKGAGGTVKNMLAATFEKTDDYMPRLMQLRDTLMDYCAELEQCLQ